MQGPIVGIIRDFHDQSFRDDINAVCISSQAERYNNYAIKVNPANISSTLSALEKAWSEMHPDEIYEYEFLDEHIAGFYETDEWMLKLIQIFSIIAVFIGCLGLYGLVSFMAVQKTKEIGIRKVLGGSIAHILWIFGKEFSRLILVAFLISAPIGWWVMNSWLQDFRFRIPISPWIFILAISVSIVIAAVSVGYRSIRAAISNPIKNLRTE
jgi:ABC-type antimicrobial peptide transport system permease subunit